MFNKNKIGNLQDYGNLECHKGLNAGKDDTMVSGEYNNNNKNKLSTIDRLKQPVCLKDQTNIHSSRILSLVARVLILAEHFSKNWPRRLI